MIFYVIYRDYDSERSLAKLMKRETAAKRFINITGMIKFVL